MLSIGIIWNTAQSMKEDIINDMNGKVNVICSFDMDLEDKYIEFVNSIYSSENMEQYKIDNKISHMILDPNTNVTVVLFDFNPNVIEYHPFKKKNVYKELEDCKKYIRDKYKEYVDNYTFDIVFHATDSLEELQNCYNVLLRYIEEHVCEQTTFKKRILSIEDRKNG